MTTKSLGQAAVALERARQALATARRQLATGSKVGAPAVVLSGKWKRAKSLLDPRRESLMAYPGVVGTALGYRRRGTAELREICAVVFVKKKLSPSELRQQHAKQLPRTLSRGKQRLPVDVVELGRLRSQAGRTASIGRDNNPVTAGTIGALGVDLATNDPIIITAMHVTASHTFMGPVSMTIPSRDDDPTPPGSGTLTGGTTMGVDAAKIRVDSVASIRPFLPSHRIVGWRPVSNDANALVTMFGRTSGRQSGAIKYLDVNVLNFVEAILVSIVTREGDSGASIVDNSGYVLGFLYGRAPSSFGDLKVFCPASRVLDVLRCEITPTP